MTAYDDYLVAREVEKATVPGRWFQAIDEDGNLLAETSNPRDFGPDSLDLIGKPGVTFYRQYRAELTDWREINASDLPMTPRGRKKQ